MLKLSHSASFLIHLNFSTFGEILADFTSSSEKHERLCMLSGHRQRFLACVFAAVISLALQYSTVYCEDFHMETLSV